MIAASRQKVSQGVFLHRASSGDGAGGTDNSPDPDQTVVRSWIAVVLVGGLVIFCALAFQIDDANLRSTLLGGLVASAGSAVAFYFASRSSDQARKDILNAALVKVTVPALKGKSLSEVNAAMASVPLHLSASPATAADDWIAIFQDPPQNQLAASGTPVQVIFAGKVPIISGMTPSDASVLSA